MLRGRRRAAVGDRVEERAGEIRADLGLELLATAWPWLGILELVVEPGQHREVGQEEIVAAHR
jgi:hypothetical protein